MSKQDRQGVRTAADIERKYELGQISTQKDTSSRQSSQISQLSQTLSQFMTRMSGELETLYQSIDQTNSDVEELTQSIGQANEEIESLQGKIYPVGSIYVGVDNTEPSSLFGGEWEFLAEGHLLVGLDQESEEALNELLQLNDTCYLWKRTK